MNDKKFTLPNTILIGAQKAGTTSLYNWLGQHPDVLAPEGMKDFDYFCNEKIFQRGLKWFSKNYRTHKDEKVILSGHVSYLYFSKISSKRLFEFNPNLKLIVVLRNPIDRAYSAYWDAKKVAREKCVTFEEAINEEPKRLNGTYQERMALTYLAHGLYSEQLKDFLTVFPANQIFVLLFEDLVKKPKESIASIFKYLNIKNSFVPTIKKKNSSGIPRSVFLQRILQKARMPELLKGIIPGEKYYNLKTKLIREWNVKKIDYPQMDDNTKRKLNEYFKEEINSLENLLKIDLAHWKKQ